MKTEIQKEIILFFVLFVFLCGFIYWCRCKMIASHKTKTEGMTPLDFWRTKQVVRGSDKLDGIRLFQDKWMNSTINGNVIRIPWNDLLFNSPETVRKNKNSELTVSFWLYMNDTCTTWQPIFQVVDPGYAQNSPGIMLWPNSSTVQVRQSRYSKQVTYMMEFMSIPQISLDFYTFVFSGRNCSAYVNGDFQKMIKWDEPPHSIMNPIGAYIEFGGSSGNNYVMRDVQLFDDMLTAKDVMNVYETAARKLGDFDMAKQAAVDSFAVSRQGFTCMSKWWKKSAFESYTSEGFGSDENRQWDDMTVQAPINQNGSNGYTFGGTKIDNANKVRIANDIEQARLAAEPARLAAEAARLAAEQAQAQMQIQTSLPQGSSPNPFQNGISFPERNRWWLGRKRWRWPGMNGIPTTSGALQTSGGDPSAPMQTSAPNSHNTYSVNKVSSTIDFDFYGRKKIGSNNNTHDPRPFILKNGQSLYYYRFESEKVEYLNILNHDNPIIFGDNGISFAMWFKYEKSSANNNQYTRLFEFGDDPNNNNIIAGFWNGNLVLRVYNSGISSTRKENNRSTERHVALDLTDQWYHLVWVISPPTDANGGGATWTIYINGEKKNTYSNKFYPVTNVLSDWEQYVRDNFPQQEMIRKYIRFFGRSRRPFGRKYIPFTEEQAIHHFYKSGRWNTAIKAYTEPFMYQKYMFIGNGNSADKTFNGYIGDFKMLNRAIEIDEVNYIFNNPTQPQQT